MGRISSTQKINNTKHICNFAFATNICGAILSLINFFSWDCIWLKLKLLTLDPQYFSILKQLDAVRYFLVPFFVVVHLPVNKYTELILRDLCHVPYQKNVYLRCSQNTKARSVNQWGFLSLLKTLEFESSEDQTLSTPNVFYEGSTGTKVPSSGLFTSQM